jgi:hypothetical protein
MYEDKYENFFLNITAGRARFAEFAGYTRTALLAPGLPPELAALAPPFEAALAAFVAGVAGRTASAGAAQGGTRAEDAVWADFRAFIKATDVTLIQPAFYQDPAALLAYYPDKVGGLTQAPKRLRLPRLMAYVQALQTYNKPIATKAGAPAAALLAQYQAATAGKDQAQSSVQDAIASLDPSRLALCAQLWEVHTTGLYVYRATPRRAAALFNYTLLPKNRPAPKPADA